MMSKKNNKTLNLKFEGLFKDRNFIGFVFVSFLFYIIFYEYLEQSTKKQIYITLSNPIILLISILIIGFILYVNFTIGMIFVFTLVISLTYSNDTEKHSTPSTPNKNLLLKLKSKSKQYSNHNSDNDNNIIEGFKSKNFLESKIEQLTNDLEQGIKENTDIEEKYKNTLNKEEFASTNSNDDDDVQIDKKSKQSKSNKKEKTIQKRKFDFTNKEDKSLVYTREVLKEVVNRINYEYEDKEYLKKYIGSKFEEIIDLLGLLDDE